MASSEMSFIQIRTSSSRVILVCFSFVQGNGISKKKQQENNKHQIKDHTKTSKIIKTKLVYICIRDHRVAYTHVYTYVQAYAYTHTTYWTDNGIRMDVYNGVLALDGTAVYNISGSTKISEGPKLV